MRRVLIVANPAARGYSAKTLAAIEAALARDGVEASIVRSARKGDVRDIVCGRGGDCDVVAVHGGDGTINEAVAGLRAIAGTEPALALIPGGTANVLAIETRARFDAAGIAREIVGGATVPLHYGLANGQPFVLMASAGLDAAVVHATSPGLKAALGKAAYVAVALSRAWRRSTPDIVVAAAGQTWRCRMAICANAARYGGDFVIAPETSAMQAGLRLVLIDDDSLAGLLRIGWRLISRRDLAGAGLRTLAVDDVDVSADGVAPVQIDGDPFAATPVRVTAAARPLRLICDARGRGFSGP